MKIPAANATDVQGNRALRFWPWLLVVVIILFAGGVRLRLLSTVLERDEGEYAYAGQLVLQGIPPYELAYNMKLPGTYFAYAAGMAVFGQTPAGVHLTLLVVNSLTCIFIFLLGRNLSGVTGGLAACAAYAIMSMSPAVLGLAAHATQFVVLFAVPGISLLRLALATGSRRAFFASGLMFGLALMMKQPGICFGLFGLAAITWHAIRARVVASGNFAMSFFCLGAGLLLPLAFFCLAALMAGDFGRFWFWTVKYAGQYAGEKTLAGGYAELTGSILVQLLPYGSLWLLAGAGSLAAVRVREKRNELFFALALLGFSFLGTTPGLYFRNHYFILMLPAFALVLAVGVEQLRLLLSSVRTQWVAPAPLVAALAWSVFVQRWVFFYMTPQQVSDTVYQGNPVQESVQIARYISEHSRPDALVAVVGSEPQLYFYSHRHSATGYIYTYPLMEPQPYARLMQREMITQIETNRPEFIVMVAYKFSWLQTPASDVTIWREMQQYTHQFYEPVAAVGHKTDDEPAPAHDSFRNEVAGAPAESMFLYQRKPGAN